MAVWKIKKPTPREVVDAFRGATSKTQVAERLLALGLTEDEANDAQTIVNAASGRALLLSTGMRPTQFGGDFEDDPLFKEALRRFGGSVASRAERFGLSSPSDGAFGKFLAAWVIVVVLCAIAAALRRH
jgi:hypothetical protein